MNPKEIGRRIAEARENKKKSATELAGKILKNPAKGGDFIGYETVRLWESGVHIPPADKIEQLAAVLGVSEEWILFGFDARRTAQLKSERQSLQYVSDSESEFLTMLRQVDPAAHPAMVEYLRMMMKHTPAKEADIIKLSRKKRGR